jgi:putative ABC transport system permease protein
MLTLLRTLTAGYVVQHPLRTALVVLSIALGVAMLVATQALGSGINKGIQDGVNPLGGLADLLVVNGQSGMHYTLAKELRDARIEGVEAVHPFVYWRMSVADLDNKVVWLIGVERPTSRAQRRESRAGHNPLEAPFHLRYHPRGAAERLTLLFIPPAFVSENLAAELDKKFPGSGPRKPLRFRLRNAGRTPEVTLLGTIDFSDSSLPLQDSHVVVMDVLSASGIVYPDDPGFINQIGVTVTKDADRKAVERRIADWLGTRAQVQTVNDSKHIVSDVTAGLNIGFNVGGAVALVVGLFLVYNILSVSVAERRHDIGILRSVGATRGQVAGLFVGEAACLGLVGSGLGLPLGWGLSWLAIGPAASVVSELMVPIDRARIDLPLWLVLLAVGAGTAVAMLAALVPAYQASREEPADAVRRAPRRRSPLLVVLQGGMSLGLVAVGCLLVYFRQQLPLRFGTFAGIGCLQVSVLFAMPMLATLVGRGVQPLFRHFLGLEGRLAADNLVRAPGRTGIVIAALAATGGLLVMTAGFLKSSHRAITEWVDEKIAADLFVTSGSSVTSGGAALSMQEGLSEKFKALPGVEAVLAVRFHRLDYQPAGSKEKRLVFLLAIDTRPFLHAAGDRPLARSLQRFPQLRQRGKVCVSQNFAALYGVGVGDRLTLPARNGPLEVEVVGTVVDYTWNRGTILMDREWYREEFNDKQVDVFDLFLKPGTDVAGLRKEIMSRYGAAEALFAVTRPEVNQDVQDSMRKVYALAYVQQAVVGVVALLGVVSALFISVLQRRRELGLLRAVGAARSQVLRSVLAEAVLMGVVGAVLGFGIGMLLEWYVMGVMLLDESGFTFPMRVAWWEAGGVVGASVVLATLAGLWPAYHATRLRIPEAIAYE